MIPADRFLPVLPTIPSPTSRVGAKVGTANDTKVARTAREFEATFLSMLLKEMRQTLEPDGLFAGDSGDVQGGLFDLFLSQHLADAGGVGLANVIEQQLRPVPHASDVSPQSSALNRVAARPSSS